MFGSRHSCLEFRFRVGVQTLVSLCERAVSRPCVLCRVGAWCSDPRTHVLSFGFVSGFGHSSLCVSVRSLVRSTWTSWCFYRLRVFMLYLVLCGTQLVYSLAECFHVVMSCVNMWCMSFLISCVFVSCSAHSLCFCFV